MLNDAKLRAAQPREKAYKRTDSHRLYLLITQQAGSCGGGITLNDSKQKSLSFGSYPMISLLAAREKRDDVRTPLAEGIVFTSSVFFL